MPLWLALSCAVPGTPVDPFAGFPYDVEPEPDRPDYVDARVEYETWTPGVDIEQTALYVLKSFEHYASAPDAVLDHFEAHRETIPPVDPGAAVQLVFAGDLLPSPGGGDDRSELAVPVQGLFDGDLNLGNLESPTAPAFPTPGLYDLNNDPSVLDSLPFDALQLNNNHSLDAGEGGLAATVGEVEARGITPLGLGEHRVFDVKGVQVAVLTYTWGLNVDPATVAWEGEPAELFVVPFGHPGPVDLSRVAEDVAAVRADGAELVVIMPHWGYEYEYYPDAQFLILGRALVALGADLVVGHGPHVVQPAEVCAVNPARGSEAVGSCVVRSVGRSRTAAIVYSLGNFASSMTGAPETAVGMVATVSMEPGVGVTGMGWTAVAMGDVGEAYDRVVPVDDEVVGWVGEEEGAELLGEVERLREHVGEGWMR